jgi:hypothetical protein
MKLLPDRSMSTCEAYLSQYQFIAGQLRGLIYRAMCPQLVKANYVRIQSSITFGVQLVIVFGCHADIVPNSGFRGRLGH